MLEFFADKTERLDKFLASHIAEVSRGKIQKAIREAQVLVNGKKVIETDFKIHENDKIELPEFKEEKLTAYSFQLQVVFENNDLAVIDKPAGLMVHPAAGREDVTLANALLNRFPEIKDVGDPHRPGIVHRLDEDTSGLLLIAKTEPSFEYLKSLFTDRKIEKYYLALVHGVPVKLHDVIDEPIGKTSTHQKMKVGTGKEAKTEYNVLDTEASGHFSLLWVKLHTGRTHQIRVHMSYIGHPVFGDRLYGGEYKQTDKSLIKRQFLHAYRLKFKLIDNTWLELESELPKDLKEILKQLGINPNY
ncbi:MAG: RluA family pseudouridine synthase [bacterium]|nr:RluA family pseudouridine synthase [bacterium]